ncbi:MAG: hypothetical protein GXP54_09385, partial [Deltaproteobacteria bacterium]|nr:hypothetical protein [Deltaproteobacteria bacterium]
MNSRLFATQAAVLFTFGVIGCGGSTPGCTGDACDVPAGEISPDPGADHGNEGMVAPDVPQINDCVAGCEAQDTSSPEVADGDLFGEDLVDQEVQTEGGFKWPCATWEDCNSGICIDTLVGKLCTVPCIEDCPDPSWTCDFISPAGLDPLFACVPPKTALCRPCTTDTDCALEGEQKALCVTYGPNGRFCGLDCPGGDDDCPPGYSCLDYDSGGVTTKQCMADAGDCPCLLGFVGLVTECFNTNQSGTCYGKRSCVKPADTPVWTQCDAPVAAPETCNSIDDDCNGLPDDGLGEEVCGKGVCTHVVQGCVEGVPGTCDPFDGATAEICNGLDDDCDGDTDEMWPEKGDACDGPDADECKNGTLECADAGDQLICALDDVNFDEVCNGLDDDCDGQTDEVDDLGETTCGLGECLHTIANCLGGQPQTCNPMEGKQDLDDPDPDFKDTNCDGIDGDAQVAVFVDVATGKDLNPGTMDLPKKTIGAGLALAESEGRPYVLVSLGVYNESVTLKDGIGLHGQYDRAAGWTRKLENTTQIKGGTKAVTADGITSQTMVEGFFITSGSATNTGNSSYGVFVKNSPGLKLVGDVIQAGSGASGSAGAPGQPGLNGSSGSNGNQACEYDCRSGKLDCSLSACLFNTCGQCSRPLGGSGGASPCGSTGGNGGNGGSSESNGYSGSKGNGPGAGNGGFGGTATNDGYKGGNGDPGANGADGGGGLEFGLIDPVGYAPAGGVNGANSTNGGGGGGGGAGGGDVYELFADCC